MPEGRNGSARREDLLRRRTYDVRTPLPGCMRPAPPKDYAVGIVQEMCRLPAETEWVEFKQNNADPKEIGEYLSALANAAALAGENRAYLIWGVADETHEVVGTTFTPSRKKVGAENLESWLVRFLEPQIHVQFWTTTINEKPVVLLEIGTPFHHPARFKNVAYVRVGSYKKPLRDFPEKEAALWRHFDKCPFESGVAAERISDERVLRLLDVPAYFRLTRRLVPLGLESVLAALEADEIIAPDRGGGWVISNLGAVLFAQKLADFKTLRRKTVRVIQYRGSSRVETIKEQVGVRGYASGYGGLIGYINEVLPSSEVIEQAFRRRVPVYPEVAVRELVVNALIHQDFAVTGAGPMVEIFEDRIEITNPGAPLVSTDRFLDTPPKSRNETLASLMRRMDICEERGTGIDKVVSLTELYQLPAPLFVQVGDNVRASLLSPRPLVEMSQADRIRACYLHACLRAVNLDYMTNTSLRERFGIEKKNSATASRLIKEATEAGMIRLFDPEAATKLRKYVPFWA